jgi:hypothetical protein
MRTKRNLKVIESEKDRAEEEYSKTAHEKF